MPKEQLSQDELDLLTPDERAAMEDPALAEDDTDDAPEAGTSEEEAAAAAKAAKEAKEAADKGGENAAAEEDDDDAGDDDDGEEEAAAAEEAEASEEDEPNADAAAAEAEADTEAAEEAAEEDESFTPTVPVRNYLTEAGARKQIDEIDAELDSLEQRYDEGEEGLDRAKYARLKRELDDKRMDVKEAQRTSTQATKTWFEETVPSFIKENPAYASNRTLFVSLNDKVKQLQESGDYDPFDPIILKRAHAEIQKEIGAVTGAKPAAKKDAKAKGRKAPAPKTPDRPNPPPNIGKMPNAAGAEEMDGGKFARLDKLKGVEFEEALEALSEAEQQEYLESR